MNDDVRAMAAVCFMYRHEPEQRTVILKSKDHVTQPIVCVRIIGLRNTR